jgi:hypothetical protein
MKSTVELLSDKHRMALARFYGTEAHEALKALAKLEIVGLGKDALSSPNHEQTKWYSGQATMATKLLKMVKMLHDDSEANKKKS